MIKFNKFSTSEVYNIFSYVIFQINGSITLKEDSSLRKAEDIFQEWKKTMQKWKMSEKCVNKYSPKYPNNTGLVDASIINIGITTLIGVKLI